MTPDSLIDHLIDIEVGAARIEGALIADPDLGQIWRAQMALTEAVRSVGMEDVWVREGDLAMRAHHIDAGVSETARGAWFAGELLRVIGSPPNPVTDPQDSLKRCLTVGMGDEGAEIWDVDDVDADLICAPLQDTVSPLLGALRCVIEMRTQTLGTMPSAERLLFLSADHAMRGGRAPRADLAGPGLLEAGHYAAGRAQWVLLPSCALTSEGFQSWSPGSPDGVRRLFLGLRREVGRGLGALPALRHWREEALRFAEARHGRSRFQDLVILSMTRPVLTANSVADHLGVTPRTGLNLLTALQAAGLFDLITLRRTHRVWAPKPMADRLRARAGSQPARRGEPASSYGVPAEVDGAGEAETAKTSWRSTPESQEHALAELDEAMAKADRILAGIRGPQVT